MEVSNPSNNQILRYDSATSRWSNNSDLTVAEQNITEILNGTQIVGKAVNDQNGDQIDTTYLKVATASSTYIPLSSKGQANGVVPLNSSGKISSTYLSGEQDDFIEYPTLADFPLIGESDIIYCAIDTGLIYRWTGSTYGLLSPSLALGTTASTAFPGDRGLATETKTDNIVSGTQTLTDTRITNSAVGVSPLVVNGISGTTSFLQEWQNNGTTVARITNNGLLGISNIFNFTSINNSRIQLQTTDTTISRNIADANPSLIVNQINAGSTGDILRLQSAGANVLEVTRTGGLNQNGTRLFSQPTANTTFFGEASGGTATTGINNTSFGYRSLTATTSGASNTSIGADSFLNLTTGSNNVSIGRETGRSITTGTGNTFLGRGAGFNASQLATATNSTAVGFEAYTDASNQMVFGNASVTQFKFDRNSGATALLPIISVGGTSAFTGVATFNNNIALAGADRTITNTSNNALSLGTNNTTRLTILNDGKVGIGTSGPAQLLTVVSQTNTQGIQIRRNSTTTNDYAMLGFRISTSELADNIAEIRAVRTNRAVGSDTDLRLFTHSNNNLLEAMRIRDDGLVGINETTPTGQLVVKSGAIDRIGLIVTTTATSGHTANIAVFSANGLDRIFFENNGNIRSRIGISNFTSANNSYVNTDANGTIISRNINDTNPALIVNLANASASANIQVWQKAGVAKATIKNTGGATFSGDVYINANLAIDIEDTGVSNAIDVQDGGTPLLYVETDGDVYNQNGTYGTISDVRLKENVIDARNYTEDLMKLRVVKYSFKKDEETKPTHLGFIAQEVEQVFPNLVETRKTKELEDMKAIKMSVLIPMLVKTIQEQQKQIDDLIKKVG
jgi:hypothetical protein